MAVQQKKMCTRFGTIVAAYRWQLQTRHLSTGTRASWERGTGAGRLLLLLDAHTDQETKRWEPRAFSAPRPGTFAITGSAIDFDNLVFAFLEEIEPIMSLNVRRVLVAAAPRLWP